MLASSRFRLGVLAVALGAAVACKDSPQGPTEEDSPVLATIAASEVPAQKPEELKASCYQGPDTSAAGPCPVVQWNGITYWAHSYADNRSSFAVVGYRSSGEVVGQIEAPGARYVWAITIDEAERTIEIFGQANQSVTLAWADLPGASQ